MQTWSFKGALGVACLLLMGLKPPTSLRGQGAKILFSHAHDGIERCELAQTGTGCIETRIPLAAGTELLLVPLPNRLVDRSGDARRPMQVALPALVGQSRISTVVASGTWSLRWAEQHAAFRSSVGQDFKVTLRTSLGRCVREQDRCRIDLDSVVRSVVLPPQYAAAE